jgi:hypothetical protein
VVFTSTLNANGETIEKKYFDNYGRLDRTYSCKYDISNDTKKVTSYKMRMVKNGIGNMIPLFDTSTAIVKVDKKWLIEEAKRYTYERYYHENGALKSVTKINKSNNKPLNKELFNMKGFLIKSQDLNLNTQKIQSTRKYFYDSKSQIERIEFYDSNNKMVASEHYSYDDFGNITQREDKSSLNKWMNRKAFYSYNDKGVMISETWYTNGLFKEKTTWLFDNNGNLLKYTTYSSEDKIQQISESEYDESNRKTADISYNYSLKPTSRTEYKYDSTNNVIQKAYYKFNQDKFIYNGKLELRYKGKLLVESIRYSAENEITNKQQFNN